MRHWVIGLTLVGVLASGTLFDASLVSASKHLQKQAPAGGVPKGTVQPQTTGAAPPIKLEVTGLTIEPANPKAGDRVTVKLTIKNTGTGTVANVPWSIEADNQRVGEGTEGSVTAGSSFTKTAQWTATAGKHQFSGDVDLQKTLKNTAPPAARIKGLEVTVAAPKLATQLLDNRFAKNAGAQFADNPETLGCIVFGPLDLGYTQKVNFEVNCIARPVGMKTNPEAFKNFTLKNGWTVKSFGVSDDGKVNAGWSWTVKPSGNNPYLKMHLWANAHAAITVFVKVWIEGPEGTNPYQ